jgi:ABC-type dipeptide/oligopeptide/nickel transport system permease subunit
MTDFLRILRKYLRRLRKKAWRVPHPAAAVMGLNFLGNGLIDALDPKYRKQM